MHDNDRETITGPDSTGTDDRADRTLPVTAEVGGEGGSYADPTTQVETFGRPLDRIGDQGGAASAATEATRFSEVAEGGVGAGPSPADGMIRYPSEDPAAPTANAAAEARRGPNWRGGLIGAVAGLAGAALAGGLARRRQR
jgi:hypothetical protein